MKYFVKTTYTATKNHPYKEEGTIEIGYTGKGGYASDDINAIDGWSRKHFAEGFIKSMEDFHARYYGASKAWEVKEEVIEC